MDTIITTPAPRQTFVIKCFHPFENTYYSGNQSFIKALIAAQFYDAYGDAENVIKFLPTGIYQIEKFFSVRQSATH
jgi:hypothetical protein